MDNRKCLEIGTLLKFPGMMCRITKVIGKGSNGIVYMGEYPDETTRGGMHRVLIKELFPYHPADLINRNEDGNISVLPQAKEHYLLHRSSFEYGNRIHLSLLADNPDKIGGNINTFAYNDTLYTILDYTGGRSLDEELHLADKNSDLRTLAVRFMKLLDALSAFHGNGYLHLDISPDNILVVGSGDSERIMLIDFNSVHPVSGDSGPVYFSTKEGYTSPEVCHGEAAFEASDLYSVVAVFYRCLTGRVLSKSQMLSRSVPDISDSPYLVDAAPTILDLVRKILKRGLAFSVENRYSDISALKQDFEELVDRIAGVGITHWALWERSRRVILNVVKSNKSFEYICDRNALFPVMLKDGLDKKYDIGKGLGTLAAEKSMYIIDEGGMGKTTALLNSAYIMTAKYTSFSPAYIYVPLYGWDGSETFIHDRILENMHFKPDTRTYEMARQRLDNVLKTPLKTPLGNRACAVLYLDGLNEADGDTELLVREINNLLSFEGVRVVITSRNLNARIKLPVLGLGLEKSDVEDILAQKGLIADNKDLLDILVNPMMLSMYVKTSEIRDKQIYVRSKEQILDDYLASLCDKQTRESDDGSGYKWFVDAAVNFVLPAISERISKQKKSCTEKDLLDVTKKCYKVFKSKIMSSAFPAWIGHSNDILNGSNLDKWFGDVVHRLLWGKMGLLTKDLSGNYRVSHQLLSEHLAIKNKENKRKLLSRRLTKACINAVCILLSVAAVLSGIYFAFPDIAKTSFLNRFRTMDEKDARILLDYMDAAYFNCGNLYEYSMSVIEADDDSFERTFNYLEKVFDICDTGTRNNDSIHSKMERKADTQKCMPWSYEDFRYEQAHVLLDRPKEMNDRYRIMMQYVETAKLRGDDEYIKLVENVLVADADYNAALFHYVCNPHIAKMEEVLGTKSKVLIQGMDNREAIPRLEERRREFFSMDSFDYNVVSIYKGRAEKANQEVLVAVSKYKTLEKINKKDSEDSKK